MPDVSTGTTSIAFGSYLRIGYRAAGSPGPYSYLAHYPTFNELPYIFALPLGNWQVEYTEICQACGGGLNSEPVTTTILLA